ncbi:replicative DNA helicase [Psychrobacter phage pOW20-A]|uniref:replicative DNA helicase n=1 Tax=Psychrobacter phage pOW20-A TaxID=754048 RepID=UPI0002C1817C|nr:replicative DNA helicase [Psychrobacter phage pOW20-A]AGH57486.1 replicative DNA helicase [Psychrobacter phage pOW20-A]
MSFHNIDLEKSVIASLLSIEGSLDHVSTIIDHEDFAADRHKTIFRCVRSLNEQGLPYDSVMVHDWLEANKLVEATGGEGYIAEILVTSPSTLFNLKAYAERIRDLSQHRAMDRLLVQAREDLKNPDLRLDDKVNTAIESMTKVIDTKKINGGARTVGSMMDAFFDNLQAAGRGEILPFKPTGIEEVDAQAPIQNGDLVIVGARPSMGKTTFAQTLVQNMVEHDFYTDKDDNYKRRAGVFFSIEMTDESVVQRFMASKSGVQLNKIRSGTNVETEDWQNLTRTVGDYRDNYPMFIESQPAMTIPQMRTTLNKIRNTHGEIGVIMVDYIQIMGEAKGKDAGQKANAIGEIAKELKRFGKEFNCPVIALSQLNRSLESRPNKRPIMSDLKESGAIEENADVIMFLYRDEVYNENSDQKGIAEVGVAKNRQGPVGTVRLAFEGEYSRFSNLLPSYHTDSIPAYGSES